MHGWIYAGMTAVVVVLTTGTAGAAPSAEAPWVVADRVVAVVNREVVLESELDRRLASYKASLDKMTDAAQRGRARIELRDEVLRGLMDEYLYAQVAARVGVVVQPADVDRAVAQIEQQNHMNDAQLEEALAQNGYTLAQYREELRRQVLQIKVLQAVLAPTIQVSEDELRAAYKKAKAADSSLGTFEDEHERLRQQMIEARLPAAQETWIEEQRAAAYLWKEGQS